MKMPRQKPIPVTSQEREILEERKHLYEQTTGTRGDWGLFLNNITLLGLAAAGVYNLASIESRGQYSVNLKCGHCRHIFLMALPHEAGQALLIPCPKCRKELVIDLVAR
jgi:hypothetical protein